MKFSLILCTLGRYKEVKEFLDSLKEQTYKDFELIVVDQNENDKLKLLMENYKLYFDIKYFKVNFKGLSKARNFGLKYVNGDIVAFPDDDCKYFPNTLRNVANFFKRHPDIDFLSGLPVDENFNSSASYFLNKRTEIKGKNVLKTITSYTIFIRKKSLKNIRFDEQLGVGSKFGSAEETDFIYNIIRKGERGMYIPDVIKVYHSNKAICNEYTIKKAAYYALGFGAFFKKNFILTRDWELFPSFLRYMVMSSFIRIIFSTARFNLCEIKVHTVTLVNKWKGFLKYKR